MNWKNKHCVVTGGGGFLGRHLVDELVRRKATVTVIDVVNMEKESQGIVENKVCDISQKDSLQIEGDVDFIFHLAAYAYPKACNENPSRAFETNVTGTMNMLLLAKERGVQKFVFPSSGQLYGRYPKYLPVDERHPIDYKDNFYNVTKKLGEDLCAIFNDRYDVPIVFFRLFNSFGPGQNKDYLIPTIIHQALKNRTIELWNEKPTRDFTFVTDTIQAFIKAAESPFRGGPINIGSGQEIRVGDIARQIATALNAQITFLNKEVIGSMRMCCDRASAKRILGWEPHIDFKEGLNKTIEWYKERLSQSKS